MRARSVHVLRFELVGRLVVCRGLYGGRGGGGGGGSCSGMRDLSMGGEPPWWRPEYIPKQASPPSRTKRVLEMLQLVVNQRDTVEPVDVLRAPISIHPDARRLHDLTALRPRHGLEWAPE